MGSEFDPDVTPVDGTRAIRTRATHPVAALRAAAPSSRRSRTAHPKFVPKRVGFPRALALVLAGSSLLLGALLLADITAPSIFSGLRNVAPTPLRAHHPARSTSPPTTSGHHTPKGSGSAPVLTGLSPANAKPGSTIELTGTGFFSANNEVTARVAGEPAPTRCPTQNQCFVVLPAAPKGVTGTSVQIVTEAGASNSLPVHYG